MRKVRSLTMMLAVGTAVAAWGCTASDELPIGGSGGMVAGSGGMVAGSGGMVTGSGGMVAGSGGMVVMDAGRMDTRSDGGMNDAGGADASSPATFTELWSTVFGVSVAASPSSCLGGACHDNTMGQVNLSSKTMGYTTLRTKVTPGNPSASSLVQRLETTNTSERMPRAKPALSTQLIGRVRSWIMNGAKND